MQDFKKLRVWQEAHTFALDLYAATRSFPGDERYGLTSQLRRAAVSFPSNLAEGSSRGSDADFARFVQIAVGSASEAEYQLLLAHDLRYLPDPEFDRLNAGLLGVRRMLMALLKSLGSSSS
jgi:four helix bundle protein